MARKVKLINDNGVQAVLAIHEQCENVRRRLAAGWEVAAHYNVTDDGVVTELPIGPGMFAGTVACSCPACREGEFEHCHYTTRVHPDGICRCER